MQSAAPRRRHPVIYASLVGLVVLDVLALASFVFNQWFAVPVWQAVGLAALLALPATMLALPLIDAVLEAPEGDDDTGFSGNKIPEAGQ